MEDTYKQILIGDYDKICPICNKIFNTKNGLGQHITKTHTDTMEQIKKYKDIIKERAKQETIECPICYDHFKNLTRHVNKKHDLTVLEFKNEFPLIPLKVVSTLPKKSKCKFCDESFNSNIELGTHYKTSHLKHFKKTKKEKNGKFVCPICKRKTNDIKQHINDGHKLNWDFFCDEYKWDILKTKFISKTYKTTLSKNKRKFYKTEKGIKLKKQQSKNMSGGNNVACNPETRSKISESAIKRINDNNFFSKSYGIKFKFEFKDKLFFCRSFEELKTMYHLIKNNIPFRYEKTRIRYKDGNITRNYVLDFEINNKFYEIKSSSKLSKPTIKKMNLVNHSLSPINKFVKVCTLKDLSNELGFIINEVDVIDFCKKKINDNTLWISCYTYNNNSRILNKISPNYKNHKNITFTQIKRNK